MTVSRDRTGGAGQVPSPVRGNAGSWGPVIAAIAALTPVALTISLVPGFATQDGPAHLYNAWILGHSFDQDSPFRAFYQTRWQPLPNLAGHLATVGLLRLVSPGAADRIMVVFPLMGLAVSTIWLRVRVAGTRNWPGALLLTLIVAMNFPWLMGFTSFTLGACLFPITLGTWWSDRGVLGTPRLIRLAILVTLGYFCHLVSLGLTILALLFFAVLTPSNPGNPHSNRRRRLSRTATCLAPLLVLGPAYLWLSRAGGKLSPCWVNMGSPFSVSDWIARFTWVDPITLLRKDALPFVEVTHPAFKLFTPATCVAVALSLWLWSRMRAPRPAPSMGDGRDGARGDRRVWLPLAGLLVAAGLIGPDSLGPGHGDYLPQRLVLMGLVALVPVFDLDLGRWPSRLLAGVLATAVLMQMATIAAYARYADRTAGQIMRAVDLVGTNQRIATLLVRIRGRFRVNPILHADGWLGVGTGNILWSNYETRYYYFPVRFLPDLDRPTSEDLERLSIEDDPADDKRRLDAWGRLLARHEGAIDKVLVWRCEPNYDAVTRKWFDLVSERGEVRVYARRSRQPADPSRSNR